MKNLINLFAIALLFFATSCQKEETIPTPEPTIYPENPYAYVGEKHNEILGSFLAGAGKQIPTTLSSIEKENYIARSILENENVAPEVFTNAKEKLGLSPNNILADYDFTNYDKFFQTIEIEDDLRKLMTSHLDEIVKNDAMTKIGLDEVEKGIRKLEIEIFKSHEGSPNFETAMSFLATLKSTSNFWHENPEEKLAGAKWWQVLLADAAGAAIGGLAGGAFAAPVAAVCSGAVGKTP